MADEHDAALTIVVCEIIIPGVAHILICEFAIGRHRLPRGGGADYGERHLSIERRKGPAFLGKARKLLRDDSLLLRPRLHVAVRHRIVGHGRIDVEAVDRRVRGRLESDLHSAAVGRHDGEVLVDRAGIGTTGSAKPCGRIGIVVAGNSVRRPRLLGQSGGGRDDQ